MIIPLVKLLQQSMRSHLSIPLAAELSSELTHRFAPIEGAYITAVTTLLDPRFKKLPFSTSSSAKHAITRMITEVESFHQSESDKRVHDSTTHRTAQTEAMIEVRRYFEEPNIDRSKGHPLSWWRENAIRFAKLQRLARKYLCIPGSSVPSERLFSKAGQLVSERRNRLKPKNVDILLFLNHNLELWSQSDNIPLALSISLVYTFSKHLLIHTHIVFIYIYT